MHTERFSKRLLKILAFQLIFIFPGFSQTIDPTFLSIPEGLASGSAQAILQDSYGLLWVGTNSGLHQYDGYKFTRFKNIPGKTTSLLNDVIWSLAEDDDHNIWIASDDGVSMYDRIKNDFINYDFAEIFELSGATPGRVFYVIVDSKNRIWAASLNFDFLLFDKSTNQWNEIPYTEEDATDAVLTTKLAFTLTEDIQGKIWGGSRSQGLVYFNESDTSFVQVKDSNRRNAIDFAQRENYITCIYADPTNTLWITTRNGVYKYYQDKSEFKTIEEYNYGKLLLWNNWNTILQDNSGNVWVGNNYRGMLKFDGISDDYSEIEYSGRQRNKDGSSNIIVTRGIKDNTGILWFGTTLSGIMKYDESREPFKHFISDVNDPLSISNNQVFGLLESKSQNNKVFVGTRGGGLNLFDRGSETFSQIDFNVKQDIFGGSVRCLFEEDDGALWLGTWGDGVIKLNSKYNEVRRFVNDSLSVNSLSDNSVRVIRKDIDNKYWIGTNRGLNLLNANNNRITRITSFENRVYPQELYDIASNMIKNESLTASIDEVGDFQELTEEFQVMRPRNYFVITAGEGFTDDGNMYDYGWIENTNKDTVWGSRNLLRTFHVGGALKNRVRMDIVNLKPGNYKLRYVSDDSHSYDRWNAQKPSYPEFWGIKLFELDDENLSSSISKYVKESQQQFLIRGNNIRSIHVTKDIVWIGTDQNGLNKINKETGTVETYAFNEDSTNTLSNNSVQYIHEDLAGNLWLATNAGLNKFDPIREKFTVYTEDDGLPTNYIASILPGNEGELWMATRSGISKMVTDDEIGQVTFVNYDTDDGLGGMDFIALVALKTTDGQYFFGGEHGLNSFKPGKSNTAEPELLFTDLKLSNKSINALAEDESPIDKSIYELENIELSHYENDLTFEFAALHYSKPTKNQYAHKLIGYDTDWIFDNKREATYTNLDPGEYTFSIKGSNRDGVWKAEPKSINIKINPPWWFTTWAYIGYGILLLGFVFLMDRVQRRRLMNKARERMKIQNAEHRAEAAELKAKATESERRALELEFDQKKKELEEARDLQLSMLPKELPQLPNLDIAVYMKTATEVGGDYYDFHIGMDGTLTVVLGDATGHGMKAGTMVTTTKSLFNVLAPNPNIVDTFHEMTRCLKLMHLEKLSMCMTMLKIMGDKIQMSAAGMPPVFIYKRENQSIEEHVIKGMPLGTFQNFPYSLVESSLSKGDTILMMSDGFPELFNDKKEMFGYKRARNLFEELATGSPEEIITQLKDAGSDFVKDTDPDDDVTFVVIKVK